jgi:hypothetical protein
MEKNIQDGLDSLAQLHASPIPGATYKTLRDEFAMSALNATTNWMADRIDTYPEMAKRCYMMADAMLKARGE